MKEKRLQTMADLISNLPDSIVHHIMSFLTTLDVTRLSILSKRFLFLWRSFPVIELDQSRFARTERGSLAFITNGFLDHVLNSVRQRVNDTKLSEFRVNANLQGIWADQRFDLAILTALANGVKCMELNLGFAKYKLPKDFASGWINVLRLKGVELDVCNLIQVCPSLSSVRLTSCVILRDVNFSSKTLMEFELRYCGVRFIKINAPNLHSFVFCTSKHNPSHCQIDVLQCESIMDLSLKNVVNGRQWIEEHVYRLKKLKTFILNGCRGMEHIRVCNDKLESVVIGYCPQLSSIEVKATSLESFRYERSNLDSVCSFTFSSLKSIKDFSMKGVAFNDRWLEDQLAKMICLERLLLKNCNRLKKIKVIHEKLQILELYSCNGLVEADIDTPRLVSFVYHGKVIEFVKMVSQSSCIATLSMEPWMIYENESYSRWRMLLSFFGHCKVLKLICNTTKEVMMPEVLRERLISPLYDLQHLEIELKSLEKIDRDLVDSLLWLSPLPKTLHISSGSRKRLPMIIKFVYSDMIEGEEDKNPICCETKPIKCWKHRLEGLEIQCSDATLKKESIELHKYFLTNAKISNSFGFRLGLK